jgi:hypothetical protein
MSTRGRGLRTTGWDIREQPDGTWDLDLDGRSHTYHAPWEVVLASCRGGSSARVYLRDGSRDPDKEREVEQVRVRRR